MKPEEAISKILNEYNNAAIKYPGFHSNHEGYAVIKEEVDELWDEVKKSKAVRGNKEMEKELIQIGAMVVRYLNDLF